MVTTLIDALKHPSSEILDLYDSRWQAASEGKPIWLIGLLVTILVVVGGGFWLWQQFQDKESSPQNETSQRKSEAPLQS